MYAAAAPPDNAGTRRSVALIVTLVLHGLLVLFFILWTIITPIPPFPEGGGNGVELSLGFDLAGQGDNTDLNEPAAAASRPEPQPETDESALLTEENDESVVVKEQPKKPIPTKPKEATPAKPKEPVKPREPTVSKGLENALNAWNTKGGGTSGKGNDGTPGTAGGPTGTATGTGIGNGTGSYRGDGWAVDLAGRTIKRKPVINDKPSVGGKVVVDIWVDGEGKVVRVAQNTSKSTTLDQTLYAIAKRAALESSFYPNPKAEGDQKGSITFVFELQ
ncbi:MAG: energy transducer TonB [Flavobacteriales bacterium]